MFHALIRTQGQFFQVKKTGDLDEEVNKLHKIIYILTDLVMFYFNCIMKCRNSNNPVKKEV